jgi:hypothetical protein
MYHCITHKYVIWTSMRTKKQHMCEARVQAWYFWLWKWAIRPKKNMGILVMDI